MLGRRSPYAKRLMAILAGEGAAYGFTLTIWGSSVLAQAKYGQFTTERAILFLIGPLITYVALVILLYCPDEPPLQLSQLRITAFGFMDFLSIPVAIGIVYLVYHYIHQPLIGIPLGSCLATLSYNLVLAAQLLLSTHRGE